MSLQVDCTKILQVVNTYQEDFNLSSSVNYHLN